MDSIYSFPLLRRPSREIRITLREQEQRYPFLPVNAVCSRVQTMVCLPGFGISNVRTDVDACDCIVHGKLYGHRERVYTGS